jgi:hypothetical protein
MNQLYSYILIYDRVRLIMSKRFTVEVRRFGGFVLSSVMYLNKEDPCLDSGFYSRNKWDQIWSLLRTPNNVMRY